MNLLGPLKRRQRPGFGAGGRGGAGALRGGALIAVLVGCGVLGGVDAGPPPAPPGALPPVVREARALLRAHRSREALDRLLADGAPRADAPEAAWLYALVAPAHVGLAEVTARLAALPRAGLRGALLALVDARPAARCDELGLALRRGGDPWLFLALATLRLRVGDNGAALESASQVQGNASVFVRAEAAQVEARAHAEEGRLEQAVGRARHAAALTPDDSRPLALEAECERRRGRLAGARSALVAALARDPGSQVYARRLADLLREEPGSTLEPAWSAAMGAVESPHNPERWALEGLEAERRSDPAGAARRYETALAAGAAPVPVEHALGRLWATQGRYAALVDLLRRALPDDLPSHPSNLLRERWLALDAAVRAAPDARAPAAARRALVEALVGVGALHEALSVATTAGEAAGPWRAALERHLAFEEALRAEVEAGYRAGAEHRPPPAFDAFLARLATLAETHLPAEDAAQFARSPRGVRRVPILGAWLDHGARTTSPIVAYFRRFGRYLVLGQRNDQPVEAILLSLGFLAERLPLVTRGRPHAHDLAVGYDRAVRSWLDAQGGGLAGACLPDALWLDADAALSAEHDVRRALTRDPSLVAAALALEPPVADGPDGPFALADPAGVGLRFLARYAARHPQGRWGSFGVLRAHENGHVIDIRRHLPLWHGLPATLALLGSVGFAPKRMEAVLERRAQLAAVIDAPDPDLAVEEMVEMLPVVDRDPEVHAAGYRDGLDRLVRHVWSRPDLYPQIDRSRVVVAQLDRLGNEQLRQAARAVVDD